MRIHAILTTAAGLALSASPGTAQTPAPSGSVAGVVRDTARRALANVEIALRPGNASARTDSAGRFVIPSVAAGDYIVRARAIGYLPVDAEVHVRGSERAETEIVFKKAFTALNPIVVTATSSCSRYRIEGFACRRAQGQGVFLDFVDIARKHPEQLGDIFRGVEGFRVDYRVYTGGRPGSPLTKPGPVAVPVPEVGLRCLTVFVDGRARSLANQIPETPD